MAGPWYTLAELKQDVADILKESSVDNLQPYWTLQCTKALNTAYGDIAQILRGRGYTAAQLDAWDFRAEYNRQQALFWLFTETSLGIGYDDKEINKMDRREELREDTALLINGEPEKPAGDSDTSGVGGGLISERGYRIDSCTEF